MAVRPVDNKYGYEDCRFLKEIDANFYCSICYNVLKEPMMCRNNEHIFCRACITKHLTVNRQSCPECDEDLTIQTLRRAPRLVINYLSALMINCEYSNRGCQEWILLEKLDAHVQECGFAPVKCSNDECETVVNKREIIHHESAVCEYRKVKCHSCTRLENEVAEIKEKIMCVDDVKEDVNEVKEDVYQLKLLMFQMFDKLRFLENTVQLASAVNNASNAFILDDILVAGGMNNRSNNGVKSVERFSWKRNMWEKLSSMNNDRVGGTSFVYEDNFFVVGGCVSNTIEILNMNEDVLQWKEFIGILPYNCKYLRSVLYQNRAILFCACGENHDCVELSLTPPYTCKILCKMPEPARKEYTVVAFEQKVLIFGGVSNNMLVYTVLEFDINTNEFKAMPSLPYSAQNMAAVRWGDQAVLMGGFDKDSYSKTVCMYNSKTGTTTPLPFMLEKRSGCAAIITGNKIVVMGGRGKNTLDARVKSVEAFTLGGYSWKCLPAMNDVRSLATATVISTKNSH